MFKLSVIVFKFDCNKVFADMGLVHVYVVENVRNELNDLNSSGEPKSNGEKKAVQIYDNGTLDAIPLKIETCELGKNLDMKYKKIVDFRDNLGRRVEDFYCLNLENQNISLFYHPNVGYSSITLKLYLKKNNKFIPEKLQTLIVGQNDLIDHTNKNTPINNSYIYDLTQGFHSREYTQIKYYF